MPVRVVDRTGESKVTVRVSEIYASVQGEGPRTGMGTIFLRFGGCNLRCPGWPCDTLFAVLPQYRNDWAQRKPSDVLGEVVALCESKNIANVCLTGGEPFLQPNGALEFIVNGLLQNDISVEAFSNGQIDYPDWAFKLVNFVMDWKLDGSGNPATKDKATLERQLRNISKLSATDAVKFVIKHEDDFQQAVGLFEKYAHYTQAQWWAGVVWEGPMREADLVDRVMDYELPWHLNVQQHKYLWKPEARGV